LGKKNRLREQKKKDWRKGKGESLNLNNNEKLRGDKLLEQRNTYQLFLDYELDHRKEIVGKLKDVNDFNAKESIAFRKRLERMENSQKTMDKIISEGDRCRVSDF
jgi:hypothetical protein